MKSVTKNGVLQADYEYNALGQQVIRRVGGQTIHTVHDLDGNRIAEYDYDPVTVTSTLLREYIWMNGLPVAVVENGETYYIRTDHIGRPVFATDSADVKVWEVSYLPFGGVHVATGANIDLRFPGQWFQSESGLFQNWMRDYDPTTGRYMQADPLGLVDGASVYGYARQNPGRYTDLTGQCPWCVAVGVGAAIGFGLALAEEVLEHGANIWCYNPKNLAAGTLMGAATSGFGPTGFLLGRGGARAANYGFSKSAGLLNRNSYFRFGWSFNSVTNRSVLSFRGRLARLISSKRHLDWWPRLGHAGRARPVRDGLLYGALGGLTSPEYSGKCECQE